MLQAEAVFIKFSSVQSLDRLDRRDGMRDDPVEIIFQSFLWKAIVINSGMDMDVHSEAVHGAAVPLPTIASPTLQGALQDGVGVSLRSLSVRAPDS